LTIPINKIQLYQKCTEIIESRILKLKTALQETQDAANNETKSSAGDKHETGRAMAQLETEKLTSQLTEALILIEVLNKINPSIENKTISLGSMIFTNNGNFFISVSIGKVKVESHSFFVISPISPIGKLMLTKKEKESFSFNNMVYVIEQVV
jgi:hypothetical protein